MSHISPQTSSNIETIRVSISEDEEKIREGEVRL